MRKEQGEKEQAVLRLGIDSRRRQRVQGTKRLLTKGFITMGLTMLVLYVGWRINGNLPSWVSKMKGATP